LPDISKTEGQKFLLKIVKLTVYGHSLTLCVKTARQLLSKWADAGCCVLHLYKSKHEERDLQHSVQF